MTDARVRTAAAVMSAAALVTLGCTRAGEGTPVAEGGSQSPATTSSSAPPSTSTGTGHPDFGVVPTTEPVPTGAVTCGPETRPPVGMVAEVADTVAPVLTVAVPDGWSMQGGTGDVGARLNGPNGMSATVTIMPTTLGPQEAFAEYADELTGEAAVSSLSVLAAPLCDYSGQKFLGAISDTPEDATEFVVRVVHIPTASRDYLVSVNVQAPTGTTELDSAAGQLTGDFEVRIP